MAQEIPPPPVRGLFYREPPLLNDSGRIVRGGMWPSGRRWWDLPNFVRLLVGGYGSGKTMLLAKRHIELALLNAPIPTGIVSPTYSMAKETIVLTIRELLEAQTHIQRAWGRVLEFNEKKTPPFEFTIRHQGRFGRIIIYSGEDPLKLKGTNLSSAGIDEPFIQDQDVFTQMSSRVRHPRARRLELNLTGTPEQLNWGYELAEGDLSKKYDVGIVQASTIENKALPKEYVERLLETLDPKAAQAYVHGMFVNLAKGQVYYAFDRMENTVDLEMPEHAELGVGMDFNVNPMASAPFWFTSRGSTVTHIHFFDEIELPNSDTEDMCKLLKERYWEPGWTTPWCAPKEKVVIRKGLRDAYPDSNAGRSTSAPGGKTDYDYMRAAGFEVHRRASGNPPRRDRYNTTNGMLRPVGGRVRLTVAPRCKRLQKYLMTYSHELMNLHNQKAMSHLLDAMTYPVFHLCPSDRESMKQLRIKGA